MCFQVCLTLTDSTPEPGCLFHQKQNGCCHQWTSDRWRPDSDDWGQTAVYLCTPDQWENKVNKPEQRDKTPPPKNDKNIKGRTVSLSSSWNVWILIPISSFSLWSPPYVCWSFILTLNLQEVQMFSWTSFSELVLAQHELISNPVFTFHFPNPPPCIQLLLFPLWWTGWKQLRSSEMVMLFLKLLCQHHLSSFLWCQ